jgi:hypothetical protein
MRHKCNTNHKWTDLQAIVYELYKFPFPPLQPIVGPRFVLERWEIVVTVCGDTKIVNCL